MERSSPTSLSRWGSLFHWPLFCTLAVVHLALLPLVIGEREDQVVVMAGGAAYLLLAALDWWWHRPATSR
ncbi:MAG TPA: hypothetical protein VGO78_12605 [Acidimicrobiales bacterium]|jgi:hypothetical protein|nr:hypothetical protein [Acidimicrobiales bacterium]